VRSTLVGFAGLGLLISALNPILAWANAPAPSLPTLTEDALIGVYDVNYAKSHTGCGSMNRPYILREGRDLVVTNECGDKSKIKFEARTGILRYEPNAGVISQARRDKKTSVISIYHSNGDTWSNGPNR
jgi:hypothetical protein